MTGLVSSLPDGSSERETRRYERERPAVFTPVNRSDGAVGLSGSAAGVQP
jgi:hypothetical protein